METVRPGIRNLVDLMLTSQVHGDVLAYADGREVSRSQVVDRATRIKEHLLEAGVSSGTRVVSMLADGEQILCTLAATWLCSAAYTPLSPRSSAPELTRAVVTLRPAAIVCNAEQQSAAEAIDPPVAVVVVDAASPLGHRSLDTKVGAGDPGVALVLFTSGTTGAPKPIELRHQPFLEGLQSVRQNIHRSAARGTVPAEAPPTLVPMSLSLYSGIYQVCFSYCAGKPVVLMDPFTPRGFHDAVKRYNVRSTVLVPAMIAMVLEDESVTDLRPLRYVRSITSALSPTLSRQFYERFGVQVLNGYGQTETGGEVIGWSGADLKAFGKDKVGSLGRVHEGVEVRILGESGSPIPNGSDGELCVRSPYMTQKILGDASTDRFRPWTYR